MAMRAAREGLAELSSGRFVLGIGVSHAPSVSGRGHTYGKPVATMRAYLEAMESALYLGAKPKEKAPIVLAALRPKMLALAAEMCRGAHPYNVTPEHTARAREILGKGPWLCPDQKAILETDASRAREIGRSNLRTYLDLPNYKNGWRWLGFEPHLELDGLGVDAHDPPLTDPAADPPDP